MDTVNHCQDSVSMWDSNHNHNHRQNLKKGPGSNAPSEAGVLTPNTVTAGTNNGGTGEECEFGRRVGD